MYTIDHSVLAPQCRCPAALHEHRSYKTSPASILLPAPGSERFAFRRRARRPQTSRLSRQPYFCWGTWYETTRGQDFEAISCAAPFGAEKYLEKRKLAAFREIFAYRFSHHG